MTPKKQAIIQPYATIQVSRATLADRGDDHYQTPACAVTALLKVESLPRGIWECACGAGAIVRVLRAAGHFVIGSDIHDYGSRDQDFGNRDFFLEREMPPDTECIVTNPPYRDAGRFAAHALSFCPTVILLLRLAFLESTGRTPILEGGKLARVLVFRNRLPRMHREGWDGPKSSSAVAFAWFVWHRDHVGPTELRRLTADRSDDTAAVTDPADITEYARRRCNYGYGYED